MPDFKILEDTRGRPLYLSYGDYRRHIGQLAFRTGWRQKLLRFVLHMQYLNPFRPKPKKQPFLSLANILPGLVSAPISSALFFDTSWYKETKAIGILRAAETDYFVKVHTQPEECLFEERQARFVADVFSGSFMTAPILVSAANCLLYKVIERSRDITDDDHIEERLLHLTKEFLDRHAVTKNLGESVPLDLYALCFGTAYAGLGKKIRAWVERNEQTLRHIPVHGDMTPWNLFVNPDEKIVLVDYERSGWQVPFYDLFHFILQPQALRKNKKALTNVLYRKPWFHAEAMKTILTLYMIDQFYLDLSDHKTKNFNHPSLLNLLETKAYWLEALLDE